MKDAETRNASAVFEVAGATKAYQMGTVTVHALRGVDLQVQAGEVVVILGPSGSGKSTLLNLLGGLDLPTEGHLRYRSQDLLGCDEAALTRFRREKIGFVFQFYNLIPSLTALENVAMAADLTPNAMAPEEALAWVDLQARQDHFPSQLSGGEQQRVAIARAIAKRPDVLLCDEPTGALDGHTSQRVLDLLARINRELGTTLVIITHNPAIAAMAHRVVHMADGRIAKETRQDPLQLSEAAL